MSRDVLQVISLALSILMLAIVARKVKRHPADWRLWVPFAIIASLTALFYALVLLDVLGKSSTDLSSTLRLITQISLLAYAWYMPPSGTAGNGDAN